jgi:hypothetical protein
VAADPGWEPADARPWSSLIGPTLGALRAGQVLLVDGLDASIRPRLSARLLDLFRDQQANRDGAQLIFTARDPDLLSCLNPDEIWFTRKRGGATTLTAHADHGARRAPGQV